MEILPIGVLWRLLSWLPGFVLRWFFTKGWMAAHARIDIRPRHDPVLIYGGELPQVNLWIVIGNRSHFLIEIDRLIAELTYGAVVAQFLKLDRIQIKADSEIEVLIRGVLTAEQIMHIAKNVQRPQVALQFKAEFNSKVHNFSVDTGLLQGIKPTLLNV